MNLGLKYRRSDIYWQMCWQNIRDHVVTIVGDGLRQTQLLTNSRTVLEIYKNISSCTFEYFGRNVNSIRTDDE